MSTPSSFWASLRNSVTLLSVGFTGLILVEVYPWWASSMATEAHREASLGFRKYLLEVLAGENGPFGILYKTAHFSMAVLIMTGFVWGLAIAILRVLSGLDPERTFFQNAAERIFTILGRTSTQSSVPPGLAARMAAPILGATVLAGAVLSVNIGLTSLAREIRKEAQQWEIINSSLDRLEIQWAIHSGSSPLPPPPPPTEDGLYPVFARYNGVVLDALTQGTPIKEGRTIVSQACEAIDREIRKTTSELGRLKVLEDGGDISEQDEYLEDIQLLRAKRRLDRFERLREEEVVADDLVAEIAADAEIAEEQRDLAARDRARKRREVEYSRMDLLEWHAFLVTLRDGCDIKAPVSGVVERIVKKGAYASADPNTPVAWIRREP